MLEQTYELARGISIPKIGLGTWLLNDDQAKAAVIAAAQAGYRMIDTAQAYGNEAGVGAGVAACGVARENLFVASKVAAEHKSYAAAKASIDETLQKMGLDYLDQMIIHSPQPWKEVNQSANRYEAENLEVWRALVEAQQAGKVRVIGVANFLESDLENLLANSSVAPQVDQVLAHIGNTPFNLIDFCRDRNILVEAYSPIAHGAALKIPAIAQMAARYQVSPAQLCVRYCLELGLLPLPKTANPDHIRNNAEVDFSISAEDMETLKSIAPVTDYGEGNRFPVFGGKL